MINAAYSDHQTVPTALATNTLVPLLMFKRAGDRSGPARKSGGSIAESQWSKTKGRPRDSHTARIPEDSGEKRES
jgi:hypothetical protein